MVYGSFFEMTFKKAIEEDANITTGKITETPDGGGKTYFKDL